MGEFDCVASIAGHTTRKYSVSADGKQLTLILGSAAEDRIPLMRVAFAQNPVVTSPQGPVVVPTQASTNNSKVKVVGAQI
ncbi:hypothetical protein EBR21_05210, partial [bacterium]|nr:hypothetical protein [bacterium]